MSRFSRFEDEMDRAEREAFQQEMAQCARDSPEVTESIKAQADKAFVLASPHYVAIVRRMEIMQDAIVVERHNIEQLRNSPSFVRSHPDYIAMYCELAHMRAQLADLISLQQVIDAQDLQLASAQGELLRLRTSIDELTR
jgi:hypothetical protein